MHTSKVDLKTHKGIAEAAYGFNDNISLTGTTIQNLRTRLEELNSGASFSFYGSFQRLEKLTTINSLYMTEVKADEEGLVQMKAIVLKIQSKISTVDRRLKRTKQSIKLYDDNVGPLENIYETSIQATSVLYDRAKAKHEQGIEVLKKQYDYHPAFSKGRPGEFKGVPFTPK